MVKRCCVANCSNCYGVKEGISLHLFPTDRYFRAKWTAFVNTTRAHWKGPSAHTTICSEHFKDDCYIDRGLSNQFFIKWKPRLTPVAVPSISAKKVADKKIGKPLLSSTPRSVLKKRERKRVLAEIDESANHISQSSFVDASAACTIDTVDSFEDVHAYSPPKSCDASHQTTIKPFFRSVSCQSSYLTKAAECQTSTSVCDVGIQCDLLLHNMSADSSDSSYPPMDDENIDPTYKPLENSGSDESDISIDDDKQPVIPPHEERKFLVFESMLLSLFSMCTMCSNVTVASVKYVMGTFIQIQQLCHACGHQRLWNSQPFIGNIPAGNLLLSSAILCAGALPSLTLRVMKHLRCLTICSDTFFRHQSVYLQPCISTVWLRHQKDLLRDAATQNKLMLAGDGRADSPGFSAKYGSYSLIDLSKDKVIILELIQSNEVGGSHYMEKQGLDQALTSLMEHGISVAVLVTDRHCQIKKWMREQHADIAHYFDVWHVAKGIKKKLIALAKEKDCCTLRPWIKSISNHVHWTAASTPDGNGDVMASKWHSLLHHISNVHSGHDGPFTQCEHGPLEGEDRDNLWLKPGTKVFSRLENIVEKTILMKDIRKLSPVHQTSSIESFHNVINHFAPKMFPFSYMGLLCRITLAALHFNENARRAHAKTASGNLRYKLQFPRYAPGECRAKPIKVERSYNYVEEIMSLVSQTASHISLTSKRPSIHTPPPLTAAYEKPLKDDVVKGHKKRCAPK